MIPQTKSRSNDLLRLYLFSMLYLSLKTVQRLDMPEAFGVMERKVRDTFFNAMGIIIGIRFLFVKVSICRGLPILFNNIRFCVIRKQSLQSLPHFPLPIF